MTSSTLTSSLLRIRPTSRRSTSRGSSYGNLTFERLSPQAVFNSFGRRSLVYVDGDCIGSLIVAILPIDIGRFRSKKYPNPDIDCSSSRPDFTDCLSRRCSAWHTISPAINNQFSQRLCGPSHSTLLSITRRQLSWDLHFKLSMLVKKRSRATSGMTESSISISASCSFREFREIALICVVYDIRQGHETVNATLIW